MNPIINTVYLGGPMRGIEAFNFPMFLAAADRLRAHGFTVLSPAERDLAEGFDPTLNSLEGFDVQAAMAADFQMILESDGIVLLPGWEKSNGARAERFVAEQAGKTVMLYTDEPWSAVRAGPWDGNPCVVTTAGEVRIVDPQTGGAKGQKAAQLGAIDPLALIELAKVAGFGADKYERFNYLKGFDWHLSFDALTRHLLAFWSGEDDDPESGLPHAAHAMWHCATFVSFMLRGLGTDDRPKA